MENDLCDFLSPEMQYTKDLTPPPPPPKKKIGMKKNIDKILTIRIKFLSPNQSTYDKERIWILLH